MKSDQMLRHLSEVKQLLEAGRTLSSANASLLSQIQKESDSLPDGAQKSEIQSLIKNLLAQTSTGSGQQTDGSMDARAGGQPGPSMASTATVPVDKDGDLDDKESSDQKSRVSFGQGSTATYPKKEDGSAMSPSDAGATSSAPAPAVSSAGDKGDDSGVFKEVDKPTSDDTDLHSDDPAAACNDVPGNRAVDSNQDGDEFFEFLQDGDTHTKEAALHEASPIDCQIIEAVAGTSGKEWDVLLIQEGWSKNGNYYSSDLLRKAAHLFEGTYSFVDHSTDSERRLRPERSIRDKVGWFSNVTYGSVKVGQKLVEGLRARFHLVDQNLREMLKEAVDMGRKDFIGFSIDATGKVTRGKIGGRTGHIVEAIAKVHSVDLVTDPAAGGQLVRLVASNRPEDLSDVEIQEIVKTALKEAHSDWSDRSTKLEEELTKLREANTRRETEERVKNALEGVKISAEGKKRIRESFLSTTSRRDFTEDELVEEISRTQSYEAAIVGQHLPVPSRFREAIKVGDSMHDKYDKALQGMFDGVDVDGVPRFRGIKEAFCRWTGQDPLEVAPREIMNAFFTQYDSSIDHKRVRESLTTASWGSIYADHLYLKLMRDYNMLPYMTMWQQVVSEIEDVPDFQTRHWDRVGGYGNLLGVAEQQTYPTLTSPGNEEVTYAISKRGGVDDITFESIVNDRVGSIRRIPTHMARAAARTLWEFIFNKITTDNPTMSYDSTALYAAGHNNIATNNLSLSALALLVQGMRSQTAFGEALEILGPRNLPRTLIVPNTLEQRAMRIVNPSQHYLITDTADTATNIDPATFTGYGINCLVYDVLTSATGYFAVADPRQVETMVVGFLNGQQEPEMFVQDQPNVGSVFSSDKITYKIRHIYGATVLDHRSFYRGQV